MAAPKTVITYTLNGSLKDFAIPFEYLARKFVVVTLVGATRRVLVLNSEYRFTAKTQITTTVAWGGAQGFDSIEIRRVTSATERLVDFNEGSILRAYDLNTSQIQSLHISEESRAIADNSLQRGGVNWDALGFPIKNLGEPTALGDVTTVQFVNDQLARTLCVGPNESLAQLPSTASRANKVMGFDASGQPIGVLPASGSGSELAIDLANGDDPNKGSGMSGWRRAPLVDGIQNAHQMLDAQAISPWEFAHLITSRPITDPAGWDWTPAFAAMHSAVTAGRVKVIDITGAFRLVGGLPPKLYEWSNLTIRSGGGQIILDSPIGDNSGMQIGSNVTIKGHLKGAVVNGDGNGNGFVRTAICIGRWWDSVEVSNVHIDTLDLTGINNSTAMAIAGNTHGVRIGRLMLNGGQLGLMMHWAGFPDNITPEKTYHPHDIHIGSLVGANFSESMVTASGCYDIRIDYINGQNNYRDFYHIGGDFGEVYAVPRDLGKVCKGISLGSVTVSQSMYRAIDYNASAGNISNIMRGDFSFESIRATGVGLAFSVGVRIENRESGGIGFADVSGFTNNIVLINCNGGEDGDLRSSGASAQGIIYSSTKHVLAKRLSTINDNQSAGGGVGGVNINAACFDIEVGALRVGTSNAMTHGCFITAGASNIRIHQASGSVDTTRYLVVDSAAGNLNRVGPCLLDNGGYSYSGPDPFFSITARGQSMSWGGGEPTSGFYKRGDISMTTSPALGGKAGRICTTTGIAGSTAVFKQWGAIDA